MALGEVGSGWRRAMEGGKEGSICNTLNNNDLKIKKQSVNPKVHFLKFFQVHDIPIKHQLKTKLVYFFAHIDFLSPSRAAFILFHKCFTWNFKVQCDLSAGTLSGTDA